MSTPKYQVKLMFEWGGGSLWCGNDAAHEAYDVGPIEDRLPLSENLKQHLFKLTEWHDKSLNWDYPPDPGPWTPKEFEEFEKAAMEVLSDIRSELGDDFEVIYKPLGQFEDR
jgi:hypothetical protein